METIETFLYYLKVAGRGCVLCPKGSYSGQ